MKGEDKREDFSEEDNYALPFKKTKSKQITSIFKLEKESAKVMLKSPLERMKENN